MLIISDASPLIHLAGIQRLDLVPELLGKVILPPAVFEEITQKGMGKPGAVEIRSASWIEVIPCTDAALLARLNQKLHAGEAEALTLAIEWKADAVLMDERLGRAVAEREGIVVIGLLGLLIRSKHQGFLNKVTPEMEALRATGFRISNTVFAQIKAAVHE